MVGRDECAFCHIELSEKGPLGSDIGTEVGNPEGVRNADSQEGLFQAEGTVRMKEQEEVCGDKRPMCLEQSKQGGEWCLEVHETHPTYFMRFR